MTLRDAMGRFAVLTNAHFVVRMTTNEASIYGARVLALLEAARAELSPKYGLDLTRPVRIEIFAEQKDFAVRTFPTLAFQPERGVVASTTGSSSTTTGPPAKAVEELRTRATRAIGPIRPFMAQSF